MFAPKDNTNKNEPLLSRHARWMCQRDRKAFRLAHLKQMNQLHAVAVMEPAHERRARELGSENTADILNDLAVEDIRRGVHQAYLARATKVLMLAAIVAFAGAFFAVSHLTRYPDNIRRIYVLARGLPEVSPGAVFKDMATKAKESSKEGLRSWLHRKLDKSAAQQ